MGVVHGDDDAVACAPAFQVPDDRVERQAAPVLSSARTASAGTR
jgi:hypothetical protein